MTVVGSCKHGTPIGTRCATCAREKARTASVSARQKRVAQRRSCPACGRQAALSPIKEGGKVVGFICRWCGKKSKQAKRQITKRKR